MHNNEAVLAGIFRANPEYEIVLFDRLPAEQQSSLRGLSSDPDLYGLLRPRPGSGLPIKAVCRNTALLYFTLQTAGKLPSYVVGESDDGTGSTVTQLIFDRILEIEIDGGFVSGPEAYSLIRKESCLSVGEGALRQLSLAALEYANRLPISDAQLLSARLYFYNRIPVSPDQKRQFPTWQAVYKYLGLSEANETNKLLERYWTYVKPEPTNRWHKWRSRHGALRADEPQFKLYVSPGCDCVPRAFRSVVATGTEYGVQGFKIGWDVYGLLRPDKIVIYVSGRETLDAIADSLLDELSDCTAHGVPFTAEIGGMGLLSWGVDPPDNRYRVPWQERESWRLWVTNRLASALALAKADVQDRADPAQFALERLRLDGVDIKSWTPNKVGWNS
jgi:hypothetical protein